jgi:hypothetical protein
MNALKIYSQNYVDSLADIQGFSGNNKSYLYDQNASTQYLSAGAIVPTVSSETLTIVFRDNTATSILKSFNRIILLNHTLKDFVVEYYLFDSGSGTFSWVNISTQTGVTSANTIIKLGATYTCYQMRITCTLTQDGSWTGKIGELKICSSSAIDGDELWFSDTQIQYEQKAGSFRVSDGALVYWKEWTRFAGVMTLNDVTKTERDILIAYLKAASIYTFVLYADHDASEVYEACLVNPPNQVLDRKTGLYQISLELQGK